MNLIVNAFDSFQVSDDFLSDLLEVVGGQAASQDQHPVQVGEQLFAGDESAGVGPPLGRVAGEFCRDDLKSRNCLVRAISTVDAKVPR